MDAITNGDILCVVRSRSFGRLQYLLQESLQRVTGGTRGTETLKQVGAGEGGDVDDSGHSFGHLGLEDGEQVRDSGHLNTGIHK